MRILLDQDGVLADLHHGWLHLHNQDNPEDAVHPHTITRWAIHEFVKVGHRIYDYLHRHDLYDHVPVIPGAQEAVQQLIDAGHELAVVTAAGNIGAMIENKIKWLKTHFPMIPAENFVFTNNKGLVSGDLLIDDGPHNLELFPNLSLMFDAPHNRTEERFLRVHNWDEAMAFCRKVEIIR